MESQFLIGFGNLISRTHEQPKDAMFTIIFVIRGKGTEIGTMGQTGETSFTHLHFETRLVGYCSYQFQYANNRQASPMLGCTLAPIFFIFLVCTFQPGGGRSKSAVEINLPWIGPDSAL